MVLEPLEVALAVGGGGGGGGGGATGSGVQLPQDADSAKPEIAKAKLEPKTMERLARFLATGCPPTIPR